MLGLHFYARAFSSCGKRGPLFIAVRGPFTVAASLVAGTGSRRAGSAVVAHGPSRSTACGIFPDQGSNPCPLHRQADSQPLRHQGSPVYILFICFFFLIKEDISSSWHLALNWCNPVRKLKWLPECVEIVHILF